MTKKIQDIDTIFEQLRRETPWYEKVYYWCYRQVDNVRYFFRVKLPCFFVRGKNGYSYMDTWSFDGYLCDVIVGGVKMLKKNLHGAPAELFDENAENPTWKWEEILDKIIEGFEAGRALIDGDFMELGDTPEEWKPREEALRRKFNLGMRLFRRYFFALWD